MWVADSSYFLRIAVRERKDWLIAVRRAFIAGPAPRRETVQQPDRINNSRWQLERAIRRWRVGDGGAVGPRSSGADVRGKVLEKEPEERQRKQP
ncbi:Hypp2556 [Branchiostoma lanceolatum]|uniref:Hypp2556 protein n=1 Tax=Branchiostoma lanceolatum TaxID=7740 RepID=A0A8J9ZTF5_BRALA|nr:Hypp2556 [Branchiostoma lanceolatum]